nr:MAG TPA: hypothetical protein [Caudoviricetes sp.]
MSKGGRIRTGCPRLTLPSLLYRGSSFAHHTRSITQSPLKLKAFF